MGQPQSWKPDVPLMLTAELLFAERPRLDADALISQLRETLGDIELLSGNSPGLIHIAHPKDVTTFPDGSKVPGQTAIASTDQPLDLSALEPALRQTYDWEQARAAVQGCTTSVLVAEFMCRSLDYKRRVGLFFPVLAAAVIAMRARVVHWQSAQKLVDPEVIARARKSEIPLLALNVRHFRISNAEPGDRLMDTRGLAELGLPDLQVHFRGLDPARVAAHLYDCACYIYDRGDVIADGHTIAGLDPAQKWKCRHEKSIMGPNRVVLDLNPGDPFAAGKRA